MTEGRARRDERRRALVDAAYDVIAARGFEGLRTRAVAARARVNVATLHYYFSGKEALVRGVMERLTEQFRTVHAPSARNRLAPLQRLRQELADASYYQARRGDLVVVWLELMLRAQRDPAIQRSMRRVLRGWRRTLRQIVTAGVRDGTFRADLDPDAAATAVAALISGLSLTAGGRSDHVRARAEIERWLTHGAAKATNRRRARRVWLEDSADGGRESRRLLERRVTSGTHNTLAGVRRNGQ